MEKVKYTWFSFINLTLMCYIGQECTYVGICIGPWRIHWFRFISTFPFSTLISLNPRSRQRICVFIPYIRWVGTNTIMHASVAHFKQYMQENRTTSFFTCALKFLNRHFQQTLVQSTLFFNLTFFKLWIQMVNIFLLWSKSEFV